MAKRKEDTQQTSTVKLTRGTGPIPRSRFGGDGSVLRDTLEWKALFAELARGLGPGEWVSTSLSPETIAAVPLKDPEMALYVALKRGLSGQFKVSSRSEGQFTIYIENIGKEHKKYEVAG